MERNTGVELLQLMDYGTGGTLPLDTLRGPGVACAKPDTWSLLIDVGAGAGGTNFTMPPLERPVIYSV